MIRSLLDLLFPPLCLHCRSFSKMPYLCEECWKGSCLIDSEERCLHCFNEVSETKTLCSRCRKQPLFPFPRAAVFERDAPIGPLLGEDATDAIAGFAYYQWLRLDWPEPDFIIPVRRNGAAKAFAELMDKPCPRLFRHIAWPSYRREFLLREDLIEEDANILLFDHASSFEELQMACAAISEAFPKRVYLLSLFL